MTLDPELSAFLTAAELGPSAGRTVQERRAAIRALSDSLFATFSEPGGEVHSVRDHAVTVAGGHIRARVYRPSAESGLPVHVFFHGGGWWLGSIDEDVVDTTCRERCAGAQCVVVSVDYRLAPEHAFPTAAEDCFAALVWSHAHASEMGGDPDNMSVGGVSAGANLAAVTAIASRDRQGPRLELQLLEVPPLDLTLDLARTVQMGQDVGNSVAAMEENVSLYVTSPQDAAHPLASPALVDDLRGLAPARIQTAEFDPLRLDGEFYAQRLRDAGVPVSYACYPGAIHGSLSMTRAWAPARQWRQDLIDALIAAHGQGTASVMTGTSDAGSGG